MYASLVLVSALCASVFAAPVTPDLSVAPNVDTVSEYFNLLAQKVRDSKLAKPPACDLTKAKLPVAPSPLQPPTAGFKLKHIALGRGTQNYTCDLANATAVPAPAGAVATLFDISCVVSTFPDLARSLGKVAMQFNLTSAESKLSPSNLAISGRHFFSAPGVPWFDLDVSAKKMGHCNTSKLDAKAAPDNAPRGQKGEIAVPWLKLQTISGATGNLREVYRVETVGGSAPPSCTGQPASFTVQYAAQYWFFEGKI